MYVGGAGGAGGYLTIPEAPMMASKVTAEVAVTPSSWIRQRVHELLPVAEVAAD